MAHFIFSLFSPPQGHIGVCPSVLHADGKETPYGHLHSSVIVSQFSSCEVR